MMAVPTSEPSLQGGIQAGKMNESSTTILRCKREQSSDESNLFDIKVGEVCSLNDSISDRTQIIAGNESERQESIALTKAEMQLELDYCKDDVLMKRIYSDISAESPELAAYSEYSLEDTSEADLTSLHTSKADSSEPQLTRSNDNELSSGATGLGIDDSNDNMSLTGRHSVVDQGLSSTLVLVSDDGITDLEVTSD